MKIRIALLFVLLLPGVTRVFAQQSTLISIDSHFKIQIIKSIPSHELWNAVEEKVYDGGAHGIVGFWELDPESGESQDDLNVIGFALMGTGDLAENPVAIRILSKADFKFDPITTEKMTRDNHRVILVFISATCKSTNSCSKSLINIGVDESTLQVRVNNLLIGSVQ